jgi:hypothetical protein
MYEPICRRTPGSLKKGADWQCSLLSSLGRGNPANRWLVKFLGLPDEVSLAILGVSLIVYAGILLLNARRPKIKITDAWVAVIMDAIWVVGSYVLIFAVPFSVGGKWVVALVAELVLAFAILQWLGIRRIRKSEQYA